MASQSNIFWCKVLFQSYIKHYRKMTDEQIVADVRQSMDDLEDLIPETSSFGSQMVRWALERAEEPAAIASANNGKKGGRPRKDSQGNDQVTTAQPTTGSETRTEEGQAPFSPSSRPAPVRNSCPLPKNKEEVRTFALDNGLDIDDALEWAELNLKERRGKDKSGRPITNWKGAVIRWCGARKKKRSEQ